MTYCVGLLLNEGMVLLSDTRTNAGLDNIATYRKMFHFEIPGERIITILTAGSLSVTQTAMARLREVVEDPDAGPTTSIMLAPTLLAVAEIVGNTLASVRQDIEGKMSASKVSVSAARIIRLIARTARGALAAISAARDRAAEWSSAAGKT